MVRVEISEDAAKSLKNAGNNASKVIKMPVSDALAKSRSIRAFNIQQKGLLKLEKDTQEARITKLELTGQRCGFWKEPDPEGSVFRENMVKEMDKNDIATTRALLEIMPLTLTGIENAVIGEAEDA